MQKQTVNGVEQDYSFDDTDPSIINVIAAYTGDKVTLRFTTKNEFTKVSATVNGVATILYPSVTVTADGVTSYVVEIPNVTLTGESDGFMDIPLLAQVETGGVASQKHYTLHIR